MSQDSVPRPSRKQERKDNRLAELLLEYRWILVVFFVLPLSFLFSIYMKIRTKLLFLRQVDSHHEKIRQIQTQMARWRESNSKELLCTARPAWMAVAMKTNSYKKKINSIELPLHKILSFDAVGRKIRVEPYVSMGQLSEFLIPKGWTLPIMPELDDLTCGGLLVGFGIEGSSGKYGLFKDIVTKVEVILGDGSVVECSADENSDLFHALPWSHGSLGFVASMEIKVIPCKRFVRLVYEPTESKEDMCNRFHDVVNNEQIEFVEGIMYGKERGVLMYGTFADRIASDGTKNSIGWWWKPWFYKHCESISLGFETVVEYIPLREYYHRHTRSIFWEAELILPFGNHPVFRSLFGWLMPPAIPFLKLTEPKALREYYKDQHVAHDFLIPLAELDNCLDELHGLYECYPIWLCPHKLTATEPQGMLKKPVAGQEMYIDVGIYYAPRPVLRKEPWSQIAATKKMVEWLVDVQGYRSLYTDFEQGKEAFWRMFDGSLYCEVRKKYGAENVFMDVFDKVKA